MQETKIKSSKNTKEAKINRTYSLDKRYIKMLNEIYIKRFYNDATVEKSSIISEGIELIYRKEFKNEKIITIKQEQIV